jgi:hypothetical protein
MKRIYWYNIRRSGALEHASSHGWQTTLDERHVLAQLKETYGDRLVHVFYIARDEKRVYIYSKPQLMAST